MKDSTTAEEIPMDHTFTVEELERLLSIEGSTPSFLSYDRFVLLNRAKDAGLARLSTPSEGEVLPIIRVSDDKIRKMIDKRTRFALRRWWSFLLWFSTVCALAAWWYLHAGFLPDFL